MVTLIVSLIKSLVQGMVFYYSISLITVCPISTIIKLLITIVVVILSLFIDYIILLLARNRVVLYTAVCKGVEVSDKEVINTADIADDVDKAIRILDSNPSPSETLESFSTY